MFKGINSVLVALSVVSLIACGGAGGGDGTTAAPGSSGTFAQAYTASAAAGELITYAIDTSALTYSYTITRSSYGCEVVGAPCHSGSGTLVKNADGTFSPTTAPTSKIYALQNGLLVGHVTLTLNGSAQRVPILGVANPASTLADIAGNYNFMSLECAAKTYGVYTGCGTFHGTLTVNAGGTFSTCTGDDITAGSPVCTNSSVGTVTPLGGGVWAVQSNTPAGSATNYMLAFTAPNGQKVGVIDFNDAAVFGYGHAVISTLAATTGAGIAGNYAWSNDYSQSGLVTINSNGTTSTGSTITQNSPWNGIATVSGGGYGMIAGNGVYVYSNPTIALKPAYFEVGLKVN